MLAAAPNWYCSRICDCTSNGIFVFGGRSSVIWFTAAYANNINRINCSDESNSDSVSSTAPSYSNTVNSDTSDGENHVTIDNSSVKFLGHWQVHDKRIVSLSICQCNADIISTTIPTSSTKSVHTIGTSDTGVYCCTASEDGYIKLLNLSTEHIEKQHTKHHGQPTTVQWHPTQCGLIVSGDKKGNVVLWYHQQDSISTYRTENCSIQALACSPHQDNYLALGYTSGRVVIVDMDKQCTTIYCMQGCNDEIQSLAWSPVLTKDIGDIPHITPETEDNTINIAQGLLASGAKDRIVRIWNPQNDSMHRIRMPSTATGAGKHYKYDVYSNKLAYVSIIWPRNAANTIIASCVSGDIISLDLMAPDENKPNFRALTPNERYRSHRVHNRLVFSLSEGGLDYNLIFSVSMDKQIIAWDLPTLTSVQCVHTVGGIVFAIHESPINNGVFAIGCGDNMIRVWDTNNPEEPYAVACIWQGFKNAKVTAVCWHPQQEALLAYGTDDGRVGIHYVTSNRPPVTAQARFKGKVYIVLWGPQVCKKDESCTMDEYLYCVGDNKIMMYNPYNLEKQKPVDINTIITSTNGAEYKSAGRTAASWSIDGSLLAVGNDDGSVELFKQPHLELVCCIKVHCRLINVIRWHPQYTASAEASHQQSKYHRWIATGSAESTVHVFDVNKVIDKWLSDGEITTVTDSYISLEGHTARITDLAWSVHHDARLASVSYDATAQIWDIDGGGVKLANYRGHTREVNTVQWSVQHPDLLYTGSTEHALRVWKISEQTHHAPPAGKYRRSKKTQSRSRAYGDSQVKPKEADKPTNVDTNVGSFNSVTTSTTNDAEPGTASSSTLDTTAAAMAGADDNVDCTREEITQLQELLEKKAKELTGESLVQCGDSVATGDRSAIVHEPRDVGNEITQENTKCQSVPSNDICEKLTTEKAPQTETSSLSYHETLNRERVKDHRDRTRRKQKALLPLTAQRDNKGSEIAQKDCVELGKHLGKKDDEPLPQDAAHLGIYGSRSHVYQMLDMEYNNHATNGNFDQQCFIQQWKGNVNEMLQHAAATGQLNDWLMSIAPQASMATYVEMCKVYAKQLAVGGLYHRAASYLLAIDDVFGAIQLLRKQKLYRDALTLAKCRLQHNCELIDDILKEWMSSLQEHHMYEAAAKCALSQHRNIEAAQLLAIRTNATALHTATQVLIASEHYKEALSYCIKHINDRLKHYDWQAALKTVALHSEFLFIGLLVTSHEILARELSEMGILNITCDDEPRYTLATQADSNAAGDQSYKWKGTFTAKYNLQPDESDPLSPWCSQLHTIGGRSFVHYVIHVWLNLWSLDKRTLQTCAEQLSAMIASRQEKTGTKELTQQISANVALGVVYLLLSMTELCACCWVEAIDLCMRDSQHHLTKALLQLLLPKGPSYFIILVKEIKILQSEIFPQAEIDEKSSEFDALQSIKSEHLHEAYGICTRALQNCSHQQGEATSDNFPKPTEPIKVVSKDDGLERSDTSAGKGSLLISAGVVESTAAGSTVSSSAYAEDKASSITADVESLMRSPITKPPDDGLSIDDTSPVDRLSRHSNAESRQDRFCTAHTFRAASDSLFALYYYCVLLDYTVYKHKTVCVSSDKTSQDVQALPAKQTENKRLEATHNLTDSDDWKLNSKSLSLICKYLLWNTCMKENEIIASLRYLSDALKNMKMSSADAQDKTSDSRQQTQFTKTDTTVGDKLFNQDRIQWLKSLDIPVQENNGVLYFVYNFEEVLPHQTDNSQPITGTENSVDNTASGSECFRKPVDLRYQDVCITEDFLLAERKRLADTAREHMKCIQPAPFPCPLESACLLVDLAMQLNNTESLCLADSVLDWAYSHAYLSHQRNRLELLRAQITDMKSFNH